jgi:hypothetical protein
MPSLASLSLAQRGGSADSTSEQGQDETKNSKDKDNTTGGTNSVSTQQANAQAPPTKHAPLHPSHSTLSSASNMATSTSQSQSQSRGRLYRCLPGPGVLGAVAPAAEIAKDAIMEVNGTNEASTINTPQGSALSSPVKITPVVVPAITQTPAKFVTREIAALDFLMNIPLRQERDIVRAGVQAQLTKDQHADSLHYHRDHNTSGDADLNVLDAILPLEEPSASLARSQGTATTAVASANATINSSNTSAPGHHMFHLHWWEKLMGSDLHHKNRQQKMQLDLEEEKELEKPNEAGVGGGSDAGNLEMTPMMVQGSPDHRATPKAAGGVIGIAPLLSHDRSSSAAVDSFFAAQHVAPGRRLNGIEPVAIVRPPKAICNGMENLRKLSAPTGGGRSVAVNSAVREWEVRLAHGIGNHHTTKKLDSSNDSYPSPSQSQQQHTGGLLDGRVFFSMQSSYPLGVFSVIRYEPKKEEAARRRKKLEEMGGGGTQFVLPVRDWRGVSYAALLKSRDSNSGNNRPVPTRKKRRSSASTSDYGQGPSKHSGGKGQRKRNSTSIATTTTDDEEDARERELGHDFSSSSSSDERGGGESNEEYQPGFLDDPAMVQGRHRHVMVGDKVTGPIVSSVIQFVDPVDLKKDLNKQFRDRFDGWEPPPPQRKYIGAKVVNGVYTLIDPTISNANNTSGNEQEDDASSISHASPPSSKKQQPSSSSQQKQSSATTDIIRMPPSLTLSKIRSLKHKILLIGLKAQLELSTVALSCVYFERLCLDCRVDKSNRLLSFAACLLLAYKTNEPNVAVITTKQDQQESSTSSTATVIKEPASKGTKTKAVQQMILQTFVRPAKKSVGVFTSLLDYLTNDFSLSLKHLFAAEWGVFVVRDLHFI